MGNVKTVGDETDGVPRIRFIDTNTAIGQQTNRWLTGFSWTNDFVVVVVDRMAKILTTIRIGGRNEYEKSRFSCWSLPRISIYNVLCGIWLKITIADVIIQFTIPFQGEKLNNNWHAVHFLFLALRFCLWNWNGMLIPSWWLCCAEITRNAKTKEEDTIDANEWVIDKWMRQI